MSAFPELIRPVLTDLLGFSGRFDADGSPAIGMQGAHVNSQKTMGPALTELFDLLNSDLSLTDSRRIDIDGTWNGVLLPGGIDAQTPGRNITEKASAIMGTASHKSLHVAEFDKLWIDTTDAISNKFYNGFLDAVRDGDITPEEGRAKGGSQ